MAFIYVVFVGLICPATAVLPNYCPAIHTFITYFTIKLYSPVKNTGLFSFFRSLPLQLETTQ